MLWLMSFFLNKDLVYHFLVPPLSNEKFHFKLLPISSLWFLYQTDSKLLQFVILINMSETRRNKKPHMITGLRINEKYSAIRFLQHTAVQFFPLSVFDLQTDESFSKFHRFHLVDRRRVHHETYERLQ